VQIDTINVIKRCHHHILFSRIPEYRRTDLSHNRSVDKIPPPPQGSAAGHAQSVQSAPPSP
jgi:hypothetical protein